MHVWCALDGSCVLEAQQRSSFTCVHPDAQKDSFPSWTVSTSYRFTWTFIRVVCFRTCLLCIFISMGILPTYMSVCYIHTSCPQKPEKGIESRSRTRITDGCEVSCGFKPRSSERVLSAPKQWAISPAPLPIFLKGKLLVMRSLASSFSCYIASVFPLPSDLHCPRGKLAIESADSYTEASLSLSEFCFCFNLRDLALLLTYQAWLLLSCICYWFLRWIFYFSSCTVNSICNFPSFRTSDCYLLVVLPVSLSGSPLDTQKLLSVLSAKLNI